MIYLAMKNDAPTLKEAALLLQVVATIASNEVDKDTKKESQNMSTNDCVDYSMSTENLLKLSPLNHRVRTVSISSPASSVSRPLMLPPPLPHSIQQVLLAESTVPPLRPVSPPPQGNSALLPALCTVGQLPLRHCKHTAPEPAQSQESSPKRKSKYVGTHTPHKVRGVLKRKFSWKNYPELEGFLLDKRDEYMRYSSAYNYTSTQKDFNNRLTAKLLERASSLGYVFERFSFVQLRDRIRCFYKSYLQALKKQQHKIP